MAILVSLTISVMAHAANYEAGQLWTYRHRPVDDSSQVLIDRVESDPKLGVIYHISILQIHVTNSKDSTVRVIDLPHCPVSETTLNVSLLSSVGTRAPSESYLPGYSEWKRAFDAGHAGVYTIAVIDIVGLLVGSLETTLIEHQPVR